MDMDLVDGYDTLPDEIKEKVKRALEQGHVDDEDWKGVRTLSKTSAFIPHPLTAPRIWSATDTPGRSHKGCS